MTEQQSINPVFSIQKIYSKGLSFEAPNAPEIFQEAWKPQVDVDLDTKAIAIKDAPDLYNVELKITVAVKIENKTAFIAEVEQGGIFVLQNFNKDQITHILGSACPEILFPYAREAISDIVTRGGFPQLLLAPVNFEALYAQKTEKSRESVN